MPNMLKIKLTRGYYGATPKHRATVKGLGLTRMHQERLVEDTPSVRGMIKHVTHLVTVIEENVPQQARTKTAPTTNEA